MTLDGQEWVSFTEATRLAHVHTANADTVLGRIGQRTVRSRVYYSAADARALGVERKATELARRRAQMAHARAARKTDWTADEDAALRLAVEEAAGNVTAAAAVMRAAGANRSYQGVYRRATALGLTPGNRVADRITAIEAILREIHARVCR